MGIESAGTKENFCELFSLAYVSMIGTAILINGVDVFGLEWDGKPIAPFWAMLVVIVVTFGIWIGCRFVRTKIP